MPLTDTAIKKAKPGPSPAKLSDGKGESGTPKQRIQEFIKERYPKVKEGTRDAIALVANWQKSGGRPKTGG